MSLLYGIYQICGEAGMEVKYAGADYSGVSIVNGCIAVTAPEEKQEVQTDNNNEDKE